MQLKPILPHLVLALLCLRPALAAEAPTDQGEAAAAEMANLYERICLTAFPDQAAVRAVLAATGAAPLAPGEVAAMLHADRGQGWRLTTHTARYTLTIEAPPYNTCALRRMTRMGLPNADAYIDAVKRYAAAKSLEVGQTQALQRRTPAGADVELMGSPLQRPAAAHASESSIFVSTDYHGHFDRIMNPEAAGGTGVEIRMAHQILTGAAAK